MLANQEYTALSNVSKLHIKKALKHPKAKEEERLAFQKRIQAYEANGRSIIPIDESGFVHSMPRTHGYSIKGTRCYGVHDWHPSKRTNVIGGIIESVYYRYIS